MHRCRRAKQWLPGKISENSKRMQDLTVAFDVCEHLKDVIVFPKLSCWIMSDVKSWGKSTWKNHFKFASLLSGGWHTL